MSLGATNQKFKFPHPKENMLAHQSKVVRTSEVCTVTTIKYGGGNVMAWGVLTIISRKSCKDNRRTK